ncbi:DUF1684 domain-containing protein [Salinarchaeum laminariae]|uniref:DUF1684 domain-containing protein n=1 Tax=Salinarchaeum laminariae TaxID=869888 RepID=UPI0020C07AE5|nr:DUF1684 domain-containing protein [Salinarchaeum laminariae]
MSETPPGWADDLETGRAEKDEFFDTHRQSPIPPEERDAFDGLDYFDPDPKFRVEAEVTIHDEPEQLELDTSDGRSIRYDRVATFAFELDGTEIELHGYQQPDETLADAAIFLPFRDKTTGPVTYDGGRYMDLETERALETGDVIPLDFNVAYSPFCAYSETFSCPLPPEENWLEIPIEAGEKGWE